MYKYQNDILTLPLNRVKERVDIGLILLQIINQVFECELVLVRVIVDCILDSTTTAAGCRG